MRVKRTVSVLAVMVLAIGLAGIPSPSDASSGACAPGNPTHGPVNAGTLEHQEPQWFDVSSSDYQHLRVAHASSNQVQNLTDGNFGVFATLYAWDGATECTKVDSVMFAFFGVHLFGLDIPAGQHLLKLEPSFNVGDSATYASTLTPVSTALSEPGLP